MIMLTGKNVLEHGVKCIFEFDLLAVGFVALTVIVKKIKHESSSLFFDNKNSKL
jgi:hypothetical protein